MKPSFLKDVANVNVDLYLALIEFKINEDLDKFTIYSFNKF